MTMERFVFDARQMAYINADRVDCAYLFWQGPDNELEYLRLVSEGQEIGQCQADEFFRCANAEEPIPAQPGWLYTGLGVNESGKPERLETWDVIAFRHVQGNIEMLTMDGWQQGWWPEEHDYRIYFNNNRNLSAYVVSSPDGRFYVAGELIGEDWSEAWGAWIEKCADFATWKAVWSEQTHDGARAGTLEGDA